jgi:dihydroflavonol-4-reductase
MILITGAGGHIGNVLAELLYNKGHHDLRFLVLDNEDISYVEKYAKEVVRGDVRDLMTVRKAVTGCDYVFHLAGLVKITGVKKKLIYDVNVGGAKNIVQVCLEKEVKRLMYVSSVHALYEPEKSQCVEERLCTNLNSLHGDYAKSKAMATIEVINGIQKGLDAVIVFPSGIIGPNDYKTSYTGSAIESYINSDKTQYFFDGAYDFVDVRDAADGIYKAFKKGEKGQGYILSGSVASLEDIMKEVESGIGKKIKKKRISRAFVRMAAFFAPVYYKIARKKPVLSKYSIDVLMSNCNISNKKARTKLGYKPRPLSETIRDIVRWRLKFNKSRI